MTTATAALDLDALNTMDRAGFVAALGATFEHSPWVAEGAFTARPFRSVDALHAAMLAVVAGLPHAQQVAFLNGHPELAGKEAQVGTMTNDSVAEQSSAGLDALSRDEMREMTRLNAQYRARHGFPFIVAVRRYSKAQIFDEMRRRIGNPGEAERAEALAQIGAITRLRLARLLPG